MSTDLRREENLGAPKSEFLATLERRWSQGHFLCVGLDSDLDKIPREFLDNTASVGEAILAFNREIVDTTHDLVCAYKPNVAFYESHGVEGAVALASTVRYIKSHYSGIPVILDAKRGDIGKSNEQYAEAIFDVLGADAVTLNPYMGREAMEPFLKRRDKGNIYLVKTSNPGGGEFQDLPIDTGRTPLYQIVAKNIAEEWNVNGNCAIVVGATYPHQLPMIRKIAPNLPFLIPGLGSQGGKAEDLANAFSQDGTGVIGNNASGIIFAKPVDGETPLSAVRREAQKWHDAILQARPV